MDYYDILLAKKLSGGGGGDITVEGLTVEDNGTYTAPSGKAYSPVVVNLPLDEKTITANGEYLASTDDLKGFSKVTVNVAGFTKKAMPTGAISSFNDGTENPLTKLKVSIVPVQSGTGDPSPQNERPITGWSSVGVTDCGKNLFDEDIFLNTYSTKYVKASDGSIETVGTLQADNVLWVNTKRYSGDLAISFKYKYVSTGSSGIRIKITYTDATSETLYTTNSQEYNTVTKVITSGGKVIDKITTDYGTSTNKSNFYLQVELGSSPTTFAPYNGTTTPISLGQTVYGGELDVTTGVLTVTLKKVTLASVGWSYADGIFTSNAISDIKLRPAGAPVEVYTEIFKSTGGIDGNYQITQVINSSRLRARDDDYTDASTFETAMANEVLIYPLATPITIQLTPTQITTLLGQNNLWADSGDVLEGEYFVAL